MKKTVLQVLGAYLALSAVWVHSQVLDFTTEHAASGYVVNNASGSGLPTQSTFSDLTSALQHLTEQFIFSDQTTIPVTRHGHSIASLPGLAPRTEQSSIVYGGPNYVQLLLQGGNVSAYMNSDNRQVSLTPNGILFGICTDSVGNKAHAYVRPPNPSPLCACENGLKWDPLRLACVIAVTPLKIGIIPAKKNDPAGGPTCPNPQPRTATPINILQGTKSFYKSIGNIGSEALSLEYNSANQYMPGPDKNFYRALGFGSNWKLSIQRSLTFQTVNGSGGYVHALRSDGSTLTFSRIGNTYTNVDANSSYRLAVVMSQPLCNYCGVSPTSTYYLTDPSGNVETYTRAVVDSSNGIGYLSRITYAKGSYVDLTWNQIGSEVIPASMTADNGRQILFKTGVAGSPDAQRIVRIEDVAGAVLATFSYTLSGDLTVVSPVQGELVTYLYEGAPGLITGVIDGNGSRFLTVTYDAQGRPTGTSLAGGVGAYSVSGAPDPKPVQITNYDLATNTLSGTPVAQGTSGPVTVTYPNGQSVVMTSTLVNGANSLTNRSQSAGSGCSASTSSIGYDEQGRVQSVDDFTQQRTCYGYDLNGRNNIVIEGLSNTVDCVAVLPAAAALPANSRKTSMTFDVVERMPNRVVGPGVITTNVYNGRPDPFNGGAIADCTLAALLPDGRKSPMLCKTVIQASFDKVGDGAPAIADPRFDDVILLLHADPGVPLRNEKSGNPLYKSTDVNVFTSFSKFGGGSVYTPAYSNSYLFAGSPPQVEKLFSQGVGDFTMETFIATNIANQTGAVFTVMNYDNSLRGGMLIASYANGSLSSLVMRLRSTSGSIEDLVVDATSSGFTAALNSPYQWNHVAVTKSGQTFAFFINGKWIASRSATGAPLLGDYLASSSNIGIGTGYSTASGFILKLSAFFDESRITLGAPRYTADFPVPAQMFKNTSSTVDTTVANTVNSYTYDASGKVLTAKDSLNRTTSYSYYTATSFTGVAPNEVGATVGDLQSTTNAAGQVTTFNSYDRVGRLLQSADPKGVVTQVSYTPRGWVSTVSTTAPGQSARTTTYSYDGVGQVIGVQSPDGTSVSYSYDAAHRLTGATDDKGNSVTYTLDNMGNRTNEETKDPQGVLQRTIARSFDALNRLQQVTGAGR